MSHLLPDTAFFAAIARDLSQCGYSIQPQGLPPTLLELLWQELRSIPTAKFKRATTGRLHRQTLNPLVRNNAICWIDDDTTTGKAWLAWAQALQHYLNTHLFLGLTRFESHFAHYAPGDFYQTHLDAFKGQANRKLSLLAYLNRDWHEENGGQLVLEVNGQRLPVLPHFATLVIFLSEDFPHEVLPANRDRYAIAGWFRIDQPTTFSAAH